MASPPHRTSSPYPPPPKQPKKRLPFPLNAQTPNPKRRKPPGSSAITSGASHPLRQTSFPPEESARPDDGQRSPSVESETSILTGVQSVVTAGTGAKRRKRGGKQIQKEGVGEGSVVSGVVPRGVTGGPQVEEEEEEEDLDEGLEDDGEKLDKAAEKKKLAVLVEAFDAEQNERHDTFRRVKLKKETVRKIANQTLSQSLPPSVITTINGYTKVFIGNLIERAREVQFQYEAPSSSLSSPPLSQPYPSDPPPSQPYPSDLPSSQPSISFMDMDPVDHDDIFGTGHISSSFFPSTSPYDSKDPELEEDKRVDLGPLLPDHLREALRRYKRDGEGGGTGMAGVSFGLGVQGTGAARLGGKRLFR